MREIQMIGMELRRLFKAKRTWLFEAALFLIPVLCVTDMFGLASSYMGGMTSVLVLQPAQRAVFFSVFVTILFVLWEMSQVQRNHTDYLLDAVSSPMRRALRQTAALLLATLIGFLLSMLVIVPYTAVKMGVVFRWLPFVAAWGALYFGGIVTALLLTAGFYLLTRMVPLSFLASCGLVAASFMLWGSANSHSFLLFWVQSNVGAFSDASGSWLAIELILYLRLVWLCAALGVYGLGFSATRRYGLGLIGSLGRSARRVLPVALVVGLGIAAGLLAANQPFMDNGPLLQYRASVDPATGIVVYDTNENAFTLDAGSHSAVTITNCKAEVTVNSRQGRVTGLFTCKASNRSTKSDLDVAFEIAPGLDFWEVTLDGQPISYEKNPLDNFMGSVYHLQIPSAKEGELRIRYGGQPRSDRGNGPQLRMYGVTKEFVFLQRMFPTSMHVYNTIECVLRLPEELVPLIPGVEVERTDSPLEGFSAYAFQAFGSDWLFAGDYITETFEAGGMDVQFMYLRGRRQVMEEARASETVADVINFFAETFGSLDYKDQPMVIAELDGSFVGGGWGLGHVSVFGESLFMGAVYKGSEASGSNEGGQGIGVAVHEIAHQWWGWGVDTVTLLEETNTPWSGEGLTVYSTYLYMKNRYGEEYARAYFTDVWRENALRMQNAFYLNHLQYASKLPADDAAAIYSAFATTTRYDLMPMLLLKAEALTGGEEAFLLKLRDIHQKYSGKTLSYAQFLRELGLTKEEVMLDEL